MDAPLPRRLFAEFLGSAFLAATVVGSGIAAAQLSPGDTGLQLLENALATAAGLFTLILMFGPVSGAHFNPVVSLVDAAFGGLRWRHAFAYIPAQVAGCIAGAIAANLMFDLSAVSIATTHRASPPHLFAEVIATLGLLLVIFSLARSGRGNLAPAAVGAYIGLLLHQLDQLRQPGDRRRPHVLRHLRRHRPGLGPSLRRRAAAGRDGGDRGDPRSLSRPNSR
jgi:glycerol uptake facilitator-like aquaporin